MLQNLLTLSTRYHGLFCESLRFSVWIPGETELVSQGLFDVAQLKSGETLVVSGAAGATGSVVCQLGKLVGAKVIAIAGADDKCKWLEEDLGVDKALNYKSPTFTKDFKESVGYLDAYFDNGMSQNQTITPFSS